MSNREATRHGAGCVDLLFDMFAADIVI